MLCDLFPSLAGTSNGYHLHHKNGTTNGVTNGVANGVSAAAAAVMKAEMEVEEKHRDHGAKRSEPSLDILVVVKKNWRKWEYVTVNIVIFAEGILCDNVV